MRSAMVVATAVLLLQTELCAQPSSSDDIDRVLKANGIEPTPKGVLGYLSPMSGKRLDSLILQLGHSSYAKRQQAMILLSSLPTVPSQALLKAAESPDPEIRYRAKVVLKRSKLRQSSGVLLAVFQKMRGQQYAEAAPVLLNLIPQMGSDSLITSASVALQSVSQPSHTGLLRTALRDGKHAQLRIAAIKALTRINGEKAVSDLKAVVTDENAQIRMAAAAALVSLKRREALQVLVKLLNSSDVNIRSGAVLYLRNITGKRMGYLAVDNSPARQRATTTWENWVAKNGATAKLNLDSKSVLAAQPVLSFQARLLRKIAGHSSTVYCVEFSWDSKQFASASGDGLVKLWNVQTGSKIWEKDVHGGSTVRGISFSPNGKLIATASYDRTIRLLEVKSGNELKNLRGHSQSVRIIAFSPDGKWLASASSDGTVMVWEVATGKAIHILKGHTSTVRSVAFSPDSELVASASSDQSIRLWNRKSGKQLKVMKGHRSSVRSVSFSPDGRTIASCSLDNTVRLWDVFSGVERVTLGKHALSVKSLAYSTDGRFLATGGNDRVVNLWDAESGRLVLKLSGPTSHIWHVAVSRNGKYVAAGGSDHGIYIWKLTPGSTGSGSTSQPTVPSNPNPKSARTAARPHRR